MSALPALRRPGGVLPMTTFQSLMLMIAFASLVVSIISLTQKK
ncbi:putative holin-like toxin [Domibacillus sp. 8LH]